jgi:hypothetical protein
MSKQTVVKVEKIKVIDQMLEDFAGDEYDDYEESYNDISSHHKHYSADEDSVMDIDDLY